MAQVLKEGSRGLSTKNWRAFHPNGKHMFTCGDRRAQWYMKKLDDKTGKHIAIQIEEDAFQFKMQPKGMGYDESEIFGLAGREIRCVVTGIGDDLQRHHIVPFCYRTHFPDRYKSKNHHDVVLIHYQSHSDYEREATKYKNKLAEEYNVKSLNELNQEYTDLLNGFTEKRVKTLSRLHAIFKSYGRIPPEVIEENIRFVSENTDFTYKFLCTLSYIQLWKVYLYLKEKIEKEIEDFKLDNGHKYDHGYRLVQKLDTHDKIEEFVHKWRSHFVKTMKPEYMPEGWKLDFKVKVEL